MESILKQIISTFASSGTVWLFAFLVAFGVFLILYKRIFLLPNIQKAIELWFTSRIYKVGKEKLKRHQILISQPILKSKIDNIIFEKAPFKTKVFKVFFNTKIITDITNLDKFTSENLTKLNKIDLYKKQVSFLENLKAEFNDAVIKALDVMCFKELEQLTSKEFAQQYSVICAEKIYIYVMFTEGGYDFERQKRMCILIEYLELIRDSIAFDNNYERNYHFLDILNSIISQAVLRAEKDFGNFNGNIEEIFNHYKEMYKNI